jgi:hypothetical protein
MYSHPLDQLEDAFWHLPETALAYGDGSLLTTG